MQNLLRDQDIVKPSREFQNIPDPISEYYIDEGQIDIRRGSNAKVEPYSPFNNNKPSFLGSQ